MDPETKLLSCFLSAIESGLTLPVVCPNCGFGRIWTEQEGNRLYAAGVVFLSGVPAEDSIRCALCGSLLDSSH